MSSEEFDPTLLQDILDEAMSVDRSYGQIGFMETDIVSSIFSALENKLHNSDILDVIKESRFQSNSYKVPTKITDLHTVTHNCRKCSFSGISPQLPKWNVTNPDVLFIFETPYLDQQSTDFFISSLKEVGFSSSNICMTYLLRCPTREVQKEHVDNCAHYLHTEIQIMNPKLIVPFGNNVLSSLFGTSLQIKDYKQKVTWIGSWPIYPLYAIPYVLKSGDQAQSSFKEDISQLYHFCYKKGNLNELESSQ